MNELTAKVDRPLQRLGELGPHLDDLVLALLELAPPSQHRLVDHGLYALRV